MANSNCSTRGDIWIDLRFYLDRKYLDSCRKYFESLIFGYYVQKFFFNTKIFLKYGSLSNSRSSSWTNSFIGEVTLHVYVWWHVDILVMKFATITMYLLRLTLG